MTKPQHQNDGFKMQMSGTILYCVCAALVGFVIRAETSHSVTNTRIAQLERRADTTETDLKVIKESLYEIRGDVKLLIKESHK